MPPIKTVETLPELWRVSTLDTGTKFSEITALDAPRIHAGNRFDVPGGGVLYCCTQVRGSFAETMSRYRVRPDSAVAIAAAKDTSHGFMAPGNLPADWRAQRRKFLVQLSDPLPFVDVEHEETRAYLQVAMAPVLAMHGVPELDVAAIRGNNRLLSRDIAKWVYQAEDDDGKPKYSGIRYVSRHGDYECWAIFDGTDVGECSHRPIEKNDTDMKAIAQLFRITVH